MGKRQQKQPRKLDESSLKMRVIMALNRQDSKMNVMTIMAALCRLQVKIMKSLRMRLKSRERRELESVWMETVQSCLRPVSAIKSWGLLLQPMSRKET